MVLQVTPEVRSHLSEAGVELGAYEGMLDEVRSFAAARQIFWADPTKVHQWEYYDAVNAVNAVIQSSTSLFRLKFHQYRM